VLSTTGLPQLFFEDFENKQGNFQGYLGANNQQWTGYNRLRPDGLLWLVEPPRYGPRAGYQSPTCAGTERCGGQYPNNQANWLISPSLSIPNADHSFVLLFQEWFETESGYDSCKVVVSEDNGVTYRLLSGKSGTSNGWQQRAVDLSAYAGKTIKVAFQLKADGCNAYTGWYVDNVQVVKAGLVLQTRARAAVADSKQYNVFWQPITPVGALEQLNLNPQRKGAVTTGGGGRVGLPAAWRVTDAKGFYVLQEAAPTAGRRVPVALLGRGPAPSQRHRPSEATAIPSQPRRL
jgi:hypothetical protein